jgi:predicted nucleic-acid-binding protein
VIAVDINVIVRVLTRDDSEQAPRARALLESGEAFVRKTVVLETEWVLRSVYKFERPAIEDGLSRLLGLPDLEIEDRSAIARALEWYGQGLDFADALHLASSGRAASFVTFDRALQRRARRLALAVPVVLA